MKFCKSTYLSLFFLSCFTASFSLNTFQNFKTVKHSYDLNHNKNSAVSNKLNDSNLGINILFEKNENETDKSINIHSCILPDYISPFQFQISNSTYNCYAIAKLISFTPIYLKVCNLRI